MNARIDHVTHKQTAEHPHGLLLALARHVLLVLQQRDLPIPREIPPYSADPDVFARQMEVFERMRETNRRAKEDQS